MPACLLTLRCVFSGLQVFSSPSVTFNKIAPSLCPAVTDTFEPAANDLSDIQALLPQVDLSQAVSGSLTNWVANTGNVSNQCGVDAVIGGKEALVFNTPGERLLQSKAINSLYGGAVSFLLKYGGSAQGCPGATFISPENTVYLEYSNDGGLSWAQLATYTATAVGSWQTLSATLPPAARATSVQIRFRQPAPAGVDARGVFALDNVNVLTYPPTANFQIDSIFPHSGPTDGNTPVIVRGVLPVPFYSFLSAASVCRPKPGSELGLLVRTVPCSELPVLQLHVRHLRVRPCARAAAGQCAALRRAVSRSQVRCSMFDSSL